MRPRLLASDLDGTLLLPDATVSPRVVQALAAARAAGIVIVLVTARSWRSAHELAEAAGVDGLLVCSNGAIVFDLDRRAVVHARHFDRPVLDAFLSRAVAEAGAVVAWETATAAFRTAAYQDLAQRDPNYSPAYMKIVEFAEEVGADHVVTKVLVRHATLTPAELLGRLEALDEPVTCTTSGGPFVEVMAPGVTKALALAELCAELGIVANEVVAVGDQPNDLPMLRWAGRGVAMANAHPAVLAAIAERTTSNVEDGLARVIESFL